VYTQRLNLGHFEKGLFSTSKRLVLKVKKGCFAIENKPFSKLTQIKGGVRRFLFWFSV
jgi:hypothetical protein